jgi:hypothetical protein
MGRGSSRPIWFFPPPRPPPPPPDPEVIRLYNERNDYFNYAVQISREYTNYYNKHNWTLMDWRAIMDAREEEQKIADEKARVAAEEAKQFQETTFNNTVNIVNKDINSHIDRKNTYFNDQNQTIYNSFTIFAKKTAVEKDNLISIVDKQNKQIETQLQRLKQEEKENNRQKHIKAEYVSIEINKLLEKNKIIFYIYYFLLFISTIIIYFNDHYKDTTIIGIFILLMIYPYFIYYLELLIYNLFMYLYVLYQSTPLYNGMFNM